ncbi:GPW/gp25 family protein [Deinococcus roseus]|uniref:IraD/Gp25-like domain-containing protein n=1 Tax=Deinococcus roseus TaxID=392414 RepID=A0ABQ2CZT8_9DEIO|nr:GPW/gp25 family protein [Deinococcus roseus]GGJ33387.1 hypothetical protein GCM10008938_19550 [Deinococcus roseus]
MRDSLLGTGLNFPLQIKDGRFVYAAGTENILQNIEIILRTQVSERLRAPEFGAGLERLLFEPNTPATRHLIASRVELALQQWEKRISVKDVAVLEDPQDETAVIVQVQYQLVASGTTHETRFAMQLGGA